MIVEKHKIQHNQPVIKQLDEAAINRIAAGEVIERPSSAVKELIENSIDAGATSILVDVADGGKTLIRVTDDGCGMTPTDLPLAVSRHATSKLNSNDLFNISTFGFRGEALPSLGAVSRLNIKTKGMETDAAELAVDAGIISKIKPIALNQGAVIELRDLFYATPARLKFLRTDRTELQEINKIVKSLSIAYPYISFKLRDISQNKDRFLFNTASETGANDAALKKRISRVLDPSFVENSCAIKAERENFKLSGYAALPTFSRGSTNLQHIFINQRPVKDKILIGAVKAAYSDFLAKDRYPAVVLFLECDPHFVDVNVHPSKLEVRFREPGVVRGLVISAIRHALAEAGHRASSTIAGNALGSIKVKNSFPSSVYQMDPNKNSFRNLAPDSIFERVEPNQIDSFGNQQFKELETPTGSLVNNDIEDQLSSQFPLGAARGQVHENYIIAQTEDSVVIVDQHAAHERLVYEKLKKQMVASSVARQVLLIPEIIELSSSDITTLIMAKAQLFKSGLVLEEFGENAIIVHETPALLGDFNVKSLILDIMDELSNSGNSKKLEEEITSILSRTACHGSIRSGRRLNQEEMNALLREMEVTPYSGQCNHGRPTYIELKLKDIERLFGRT
ncbi:DNA mismatch repair endonuclease MutL [Rhodobacteraceae bacterium]|nr:DNA mismatch repair endonuclease MutL [Paracoccaceae bacterium]